MLTVLFRTDDTAAAEQSQVPVLRVQTDLRSIAVRVTDKQGHDVRGLSSQDFAVYEDGRLQKISFFGAENLPTSLAVLVDSSGTMDVGAKLGSAKAVAAQFMHSGRPEDEVSAMDFTDEVGPFEQLTQKQLVNAPSVPLVSGIGEGSALYDAIALALCHLQGSKNLRQAVVVITDGVDQNSRLTLEQLIGLVRSSRAQLFMIGWHIKREYNLNGHVEKRLTLANGHDIDNPGIVFDRLTKESGAESFSPTSEEGLSLALKRVSDLIEAQYTLAYYPEVSSKNFRRVQVKMRRRDLVATARHGVGSENSVSVSVHFVDGTCTVSPEAHPYPYEPEVTHADKRLIYRENFSDSRSGWPNREGSRYIRGGYELSNVGTPTPATIHTEDVLLDSSPQKLQRNVVAAYGPWWVDFRASVVMNASLTMKLIRDQSPNSQPLDQDRPAAGFVFRLNKKGYYALLLSGNNQSKHWWLKLVKRDYGSSPGIDIVPWTRIDVPKSAAEEIKLSVERIGNEISLIANDQPVTHIKDDSFAQGYVGFVISGAARAIFRDLTVEEVP